VAYLRTEKGSTPTLNEFDESKYDREWLQIGGFLKTMTPDVAWTREETNRIDKKAYRFFLRNGCLWKHLKKRNDITLRVVAKKEEQEELLAAYHESPWAGHDGTAWATFEKLKGKVLVAGTVPRRALVRDDLRKLSNALHSPTSGRAPPDLPPTVHFKWMVDLVTMPMGVGQMRYLVLAREDLTNHVEGRVL
jgi:hypothetical protein